MFLNHPMQAVVSFMNQEKILKAIIAILIITIIILTFLL